jgi:hypothetical protein
MDRLAIPLCVVAQLGLCPLAATPARADEDGGSSLRCHVRQTQTMPVPAASLRPPRRRGGYWEWGLASHTALWATRGVPDDRRLDLYVARQHVAGYLAFSFQRWLSLGASAEIATGGGEVEASPGPLGPPGGVMGGSGLHLGFHFTLSSRMQLDWVSDFWFYSVRYGIASQAPIQRYDPLYREYEDGPCPPPEPKPAPLAYRRVHFVMRTQLTWGLALGRHQLVVALGARNVPHHVRDGPESWNAVTHILERRVAHTIYPYVYVGGHFRLSRRFSLSAGLTQPLWHDPAVFVPVVTLGLHFVSAEPGWPTR